jgi:hypothetical protein
MNVRALNVGASNLARPASIEKSGSKLLRSKLGHEFASGFRTCEELRMLN